MVDKENTEKKIHKYDSSEKKHQENDIQKILNNQNLKILEEEITDDAAIRLYNLIINPPNNPQKKKIIEEALHLFPEPEKSTEIEIDL